ELGARVRARGGGRGGSRRRFALGPDAGEQRGAGADQYRGGRGDRGGEPPAPATSVQRYRRPTGRLGPRRGPVRVRSPEPCGERRCRDITERHSCLHRPGGIATVLVTRFAPEGFGE